MSSSSGADGTKKPNVKGKDITKEDAFVVAMVGARYASAPVLSLNSWAIVRLHTWLILRNHFQKNYTRQSPAGKGNQQ